MNSTKAMAHKTGVLYVLFMILSIIGEFFFPTFMVPGDATATASNITSAEPTYRIAIFIGFVTLIIFLILVVFLYELLKDVNKSQAILMVIFVSVGVAVALANLLNKFAPMVFLSGADYLSVFTKPQLDALTLGFLRIHSVGTILTMAFWGLWLFPFGILVIRSGFLPRILGFLLLLAGLAYLISSVTSLVLPEYRQVVSRIMMPLYFGEVPIIFWLLIKGAKVPQTNA
jgi:predicted transporter